MAVILIKVVNRSLPLGFIEGPEVELRRLILELLEAFRIIEATGIRVVHQLRVLLMGSIAVVVVDVVGHIGRMRDDVSVGLLDVFHVEAQNMSVVYFIRRGLEVAATIAVFQLADLPIVVLRVAIEVDAALELVMRNHALPDLTEYIREKYSGSVPAITRSLDYLKGRGRCRVRVGLWLG
jgi:hypothetical protein